MRNALSAMLLACLFGIGYSVNGLCQEPGFGQVPDQWAPYTGGPYFDRLQKIAKTYGLADDEITYLHFELSGVRIGPVELFRLPESRKCDRDGCYFFVLFASGLDAPLTIPCQFTQAALTHLFNPDSSRFFGFEFSCADTLLRVKVTPTHFMTIPVKKDAVTMEHK